MLRILPVENFEVTFRARLQGGLDCLLVLRCFIWATSGLTDSWRFGWESQSKTLLRRRVATDRPCDRTLHHLICQLLSLLIFSGFYWIFKFISFSSSSSSAINLHRHCRVMLHADSTNSERRNLVRRFNDELNFLTILVIMYQVNAQEINLDRCCFRIIICMSIVK